MWDVCFCSKADLTSPLFSVCFELEAEVLIFLKCSNFWAPSVRTWLRKLDWQSWQAEDLSWSFHFRFFLKRNSSLPDSFRRQNVQIHFRFASDFGSLDFLRVFRGFSQLLKHLALVCWFSISTQSEVEIRNKPVVSSLIQFSLFFDANPRNNKKSTV